MSADFLDQSEVDRLMSEMDGGDTEVLPEEKGAGEHLASLDLAKMERVIRGRLPVLELINERQAQTLRPRLYQFARRQFEVQAHNVEVKKYANFMSAIRLPSAICMVQLSPPLRGSALLVVDASLVFLLVDLLFGGSGKLRMRPEGREFTGVEQRIVKELMDIMLTEYGKAWEPVAPVKFNMSRMEMNPQFVAIASPTEAVLSYGFELNHGDLGGMISVCIPYSAVEPLLGELRSTLRSEDSLADYWRPEIRNKLLAATVGVRVELAGLELSVGELSELREGDVLAFDMPEQVRVEVEGSPVFLGSPGEVDERNAVMLERNLFGSEDALLQAIGLRPKKVSSDAFVPLVKRV